MSISRAKGFKHGSRQWVVGFNLELLRFGEKNAITHQEWCWISQKQEECEIEGSCNTLNRLKERSDEKNITYEGHLESKERFAIKKYLLIIGNKKNMQVLSHTFTYFST